MYKESLNPYFIGLSILMMLIIKIAVTAMLSLNPYFIGLSILMMWGNFYSD